MINTFGLFNITFVGASEHIQVSISRAVQDSNGRTLYLIGTDGTIYNWSNVTILQKVPE